MVYTYSNWILIKYSKSKLKQASKFKCVFKSSSIKHVGSYDPNFEEVLKNMCFSFHLIIVHCDPSETCSGNGTCQEDGSCKCSDGFYGNSCSSKSISFGLVLGQCGTLEFINFISFLNRIQLR